MTPSAVSCELNNALGARLIRSRLETPASHSSSENNANVCCRRTSVIGLDHKYQTKKVLNPSHHIIFNFKTFEIVDFYTQLPVNDWPSN